jgi:hypothetical protein
MPDSKTRLRIAGDSLQCLHRFNYSRLDRRIAKQNKALPIPVMGWEGSR